MTFVFALLLTLGSYGEQSPQTWDGDRPAELVQAASASPHRHQQSAQGSCQSLVDRLCTVTSEDMCRTLQREHQRRIITDQEEAQCRDLLDDRARLDELLERLRSEGR